MKDSDFSLIGLGYEGLSIENYVRTLQSLEVDVVVDVRLNPISRKQGFSKTKLAEAVRAGGMEYLHRRELGNPKDNRAGFAHPDEDLGHLAMRRYQEMLDSEAGRAAIGELVDLVLIKKVALLCFESAERLCHRKLVREAVHAEMRNRTLLGRD